MPAYLDISQVGNILFISSSGELSGVFYEAWDALAEEKGLHLVVTVFKTGCGPKDNYFRQCPSTQYCVR